MSRRTVYRIIWMPSAACLMAVLVLLPEYKPALSAPTAMVTFSSTDGSFTIQRPGNWEPHDKSTSGTTAEVQFTPSEDAFMRVTLDLQRSLLADIDRSASAGLDSLPGTEAPQPSPARKSPLEKLHEATGQELGDELTDFREGSTTRAQVAGFEALSTQFTYMKEDGFNRTKRVGRYITALTGERCLTVLYHCSTASSVADRVMPTFEKMAGSIRVGQGGQR